jgi:CheY-like chemotaxis protein
MVGTDDAPLRLLAVEDDPADQSWMMVLLEDSSVCPYHISFVSSMADAEVSLTVGEVDCVLLDLSLPDSWGLESLKRALAVARNTPIVVITGQDDQDLGLQSIEKGAHDYLVKGKTTGDAILRAARWAAARADSLAHRAEPALDGTGIGTGIDMVEAPWMCVTSDAAISDVNAGLLATLDQVEAEVLGAPVATFIAPQYLADTMRSLRTVISGGPPSMAIPSRLLRPDKTTLPRVLTAMRVTGGESSLAYLFVVVTEPRPAS